MSGLGGAGVWAFWKSSAAAPAPTVTGIAMTSGPASFGYKLGPIAITVTGTNFVATPTLKIGTIACTSVVWVNSTTITAVTGTMGAEGQYDVVVTNPDTQVSPPLVGGWLALASRIYLDPTVFTLDGSGFVQQWTDLSGNAIHFTEPAVGRGPSTATALGGKPSLHFNAATNAFVQNTSFSGPSAAEVTCVRANSSGQQALWQFGTNLTEWSPFSDGQIYEDFGSTVRYGPIAPGTSLTAAHVYSCDTAAGSWHLRINNTVINTQGTNTVGWTGTARLAIGAGTYNGDYGAFMLMPRVFTTTERGIVVPSLKTFYSIP